VCDADGGLISVPSDCTPCLLTLETAIRSDDSEEDLTSSCDHESRASTSIRSFFKQKYKRPSPHLFPFGDLSSPTQLYNLLPSTSCIGLDLSMPEKWLLAHIQCSFARLMRLDASFTVESCLTRI
jgi:hypothetical protein